METSQLIDAEHGLITPLFSLQDTVDRRLVGHRYKWLSGHKDTFVLIYRQYKGKRDQGNMFKEDFAEETIL